VALVRSNKYIFLFHLFIDVRGQFRHPP